MDIPLLDLTRQYRSIKDEIDAAIMEVVHSQRFVKGPKVTQLEELIAEYCGTTRAVGVASGTDALLLSLMAYGVGEGDEVITTPYTFFSTAGSIVRVGARPVFVDIDRRTYNIDPAKIEAAITSNTKAVIPVHLYGQCADMDPILDIAGVHGIKVIEDAAQAIGALYKGHRAGSLGDIGCFSFFPSKNLGAYGDGGMVVTNSDEVADRIVSLREHGEREKYHHWAVGINSRLDALQAAVLTVKLRHLDEWSDARIQNAEYYNSHFRGTAIVCPHRDEHNRHIYNQYVIRVEGRDELLSALGKKGIGCALYYPLPLHLQQCFEPLGYREGDFTESEGAARETISIPVFSELRQDERDRIVSAILEFASVRA